MSTTVLPRNRYQTFMAPGRYVPLPYLAGIEVLPNVHRIDVAIDKTTVRGTAKGLFNLGLAIMRAAAAADPSLVPAHQPEAANA
jgi:hypothetical protein